MRAGRRHRRLVIRGPPIRTSRRCLRSPHLGFTAEVGYFDVASEKRCTPPATFKPDAENKNQMACASAQGTHVPTNVIGIQVGAGYRFVSQGRVQPYVRASAGIGLLGNSYLLTDGTIVVPSCNAPSNVCALVLLDGESTPESSLLITLAAGASIGVLTGYRFRFEARDLLTWLPAPERSANPANALAPVGSVLRHIPVFTAGLDVTLERRRGRRY